MAKWDDMSLCGLNNKTGKKYIKFMNSFKGGVGGVGMVDPWLTFKQLLFLY